MKILKQAGLALQNPPLKARPQKNEVLENEWQDKLFKESEIHAFFRSK
jgi:hypothetical protein